MRDLRKSLILSLCLFVSLILIGTVGYMLLTDSSLMTSLYMTVISITTVGYGETMDLSHNNAGRIFTMLLLFAGMGITAYFISNLTAFFIEGELTDILRRKMMQKKIDKLSRHVIMVGGGQTAFYAVAEMLACEKPFMVLERNIEAFNYLCAHFEGENILGLIGDATEDETLLSAGIERAYGLISTLPDDRDNLFVTLSARGLNPDLKIIAKVVHKTATKKLEKAGADYVVCPDSIGGMRMASTMIRPAVVTFLDTMLRDEEKKMRIEEIHMTGQQGVGQRIFDINLPEKFGNLLILALQPGNSDSYVYNPDQQHILAQGDCLIVMGHTDWIKKARHYFEH